MAEINKSDEIARQYGITDDKGNPVTIPVAGSLGLLALGYRGLMAWRATRVVVQKNKKNDKA